MDLSIYRVTAEALYELEMWQAGVDDPAPFDELIDKARYLNGAMYVVSRQECVNAKNPDAEAPG